MAFVSMFQTGTLENAVPIAWAEFGNALATETIEAEYKKRFADLTVLRGLPWSRHPFFHAKNRPHACRRAVSKFPVVKPAIATGFFAGMRLVLSPLDSQACPAVLLPLKNQLIRGSF